MSTNNNNSCATKEQMILQTSYLMKTNVIFMSVVAVLTFLLTYKAFMILKSTRIFHPSTRVLLFTSLTFVNLHEIIFLYIQGMTIIRSFMLANEPCKIMRATKFCRIQNHLLIFALSGTIYTQFAFTIERLISTIIPQKYSKVGEFPGVILTLLVISSGISSPLIIAINDPYDDIVPNCFFFPQYSAPRANFLLGFLTILLTISLLFNFIVIFVNKALEKGTRFYVIQRYQKREALISTRIICYITTAQFFGMAFYSSSVLTLRLHKHLIPVSLYHNIVWWAYTVPFAAVSFPALLIHLIRKVGSNRKRMITKITAKIETQDEHMKSLKELWN